MKVAIYARCSLSNGSQNPENQLYPLRDFAKARGWTIYKEYVDRISGLKEKRPALQEMLADVKRRNVDLVLVYKLDRLGRSLKHLIELVDDFSSLGVQFCSYTEGMDTTTSSGRLLFHVVGAIAAFERDLIAERTKAGLVRARRNGKVLGRPRGSKFDVTHALGLALSGKTTREIAKEMGASKSTVASHLSEKRSSDSSNPPVVI